MHRMMGFCLLLVGAVIAAAALKVYQWPAGEWQQLIAGDFKPVVAHLSTLGRNNITASAGCLLGGMMSALSLRLLFGPGPK